MNLIIETDVGRDADDFFALLYLWSAGAIIQGIVVSPGDEDQIAVARFINQYCGIDALIGAARLNSGKSSCSKFHIDLLKRYGYPTTAKPDTWEGFHNGLTQRMPVPAYGKDIIEYLYKNLTERNQEEIEFFSIGPLKNLGPFLAKYPDLKAKATMQGGFCSYDLHTHPVRKLDKFLGKTTVPTFNLGGDKKGADIYVGHKGLTRYWVGKHLCHSIIYDKAIHERVMAVPCPNFTMELFREAMGMYLAEKGGKAFHDPLAAVLHLHPEIGTWVRGDAYREKGEWGTRLNPEGDYVCVDVDRDKLWDLIARGV